MNGLEMTMTSMSLECEDAGQGCSDTASPATPADGLKQRCHTSSGGMETWSEGPMGTSKYTSSRLYSDASTLRTSQQDTS